MILVQIFKKANTMPIKLAIFAHRERDKKRRKLYKKWIGSREGTTDRKINHVRLLMHLDEKDKLERLAKIDRDYKLILSALNDTEAEKK